MLSHPSNSLTELLQTLSRTQEGTLSFLNKSFYFYFIYVRTHASVSVYAHKYAGAQGSQENIRSLGAGVIGICALPSMHAAVQTLVHKHLECGLTKLPLQPPDMHCPPSPCGSYVLKID